jgi:GH24 family phage-related lysozyme (muramidase)
MEKRVMATWADFKKEIKVGEGVISHMYLDTAGLVTVGVGNQLPNAAEAQKLAFVNRQTFKVATKDEIKTDFDTVKKQTKGLKASAYKQHTKLDLPTKDIDTLLDTRIDGFKKELKLKFPKFDTYPMTVQFALLDMAFNLGTNGLVTKFPTFKKAIEAEDWEKAAKESQRSAPVSASRNAAVKKWLEDAAKAKKK